MRRRRRAISATAAWSKATRRASGWWTARTTSPPAIYRVQFDTTKGSFVVQITRKWAPHGADRFYELVRGGFFDDSRFFRVRRGFIAQFGLAGDPKRNARWKPIADDPVT